MSKMRIIVLAVAVFAAIGAAIMVNSLMSRPAETQEVRVVEKIENEEVLVIAKDILMGDKLGEGVVAWQEWPKTQVQPLMITKSARPEALEELKEARSRYAMFQGELVVEKKLVLPGERGFMSAILPKGMRAISVAVSERTSAGGFILPNDRVDVILTRKMQVSDSQQPKVISETVLSNVRVLAINQTYRQEAEGTASVTEGKTATLELTLEQSEVMAKLESSGELSLALRSIAESDGRTLEQEKPVLTQAGSKDINTPEKPVGDDGITFIKSGVPSVGGAEKKKN